MRPRLRALRGELLLLALWAVKIACYRAGLRDAYNRGVGRLIRRTEFFDGDHYFEHNGDIAHGGIDPLLHYAAYGDREGRSPMPVFDPVYYKAHAGKGAGRVNTLLHYAWVGRHRGRSPSPWFDVEFYLAHNPDVKLTGVDPLHHYWRWGGREGRSPCAQFDGLFYLHANPDVAESGMNPLLHYLKFGRFEERRATPNRSDEDEVGIEAGELPHPSLPKEEIWNGLAPRAGVAGATVDVIVPVYKGRAETLRCLYSALAAPCDTLFELVVIDDASPDADLVEDLQRLSGRGLFTLLANEQNCGFVRTVNRGMALHPERDVVLLNSDTEVYGGWLDRLRAAANRNAKTGTVTPLSNNATICSYPRFLHDNPYPLELGYEELDALAARENAGIEVEAPTAVGFCMYIRRDCLAAVGPFDEEAFGKGYGEENDFCQRAIRGGWRNVIAADVFVHHWGSTSFQGERSSRVEAALKVINRRYPAYHQDVQRFVQQDPLMGARQRLDRARMKRMVHERNILIVSHNRGGGAERHVQEDIQSLGAAGHGVFLMRPKTRRPTHAFLSHPTVKTLFNCRSFALEDTDALAEALRDLHITEIHVHSLADFTANAPELLIRLADRLGIGIEVNIHDYKAICPRINVADLNGKYCGEPDEAGCNQCLRQYGSDFGVPEIRAWRALRGALLRRAERVLVPDRDVADRLSRHFPDVAFTVSPHEEIEPESVRISHPALAANEKLRIVVIGAISRIKGYDILRACAEDARKRRLPLEFILMGYSLDDELLKKAGVRVTGRYLEQEAEKTLHGLSPHAVWLPSLWPETYSYTLSLALHNGLPVFAFDIGAIAGRLQALNEVAGIMPLDLAEQPGRVNDGFLAYRTARLTGDSCQSAACVPQVPVYHTAP